MKKRERVMAALAGEEVDRAPASFWGHDYIREWTPVGLAEATLERYRRYDWDFIKVNPRATYYAEAWGNRYQPSGDALHGPLDVDYVLKTARDLDRLAALDVQEGPFGEQLAALRLIAESLAGEAPFIQTVFSPLAVVGRLANGDLGSIRRYMREDGEALHRALDAIAQTLSAYAKACLDAGADGIFFATVDWGTYDVATAEQYAEFGRPYDLQVLSAVDGGAVQRPARLPKAQHAGIDARLPRSRLQLGDERGRQPEPRRHPGEERARGHGRRLRADRQRRHAGSRSRPRSRKRSRRRAAVDSCSPPAAPYRRRRRKRT